jgi:GMP synthase PP-ATPase subunit
VKLPGDDRVAGGGRIYWKKSKQTDIIKNYGNRSVLLPLKRRRHGDKRTYENIVMIRAVTSKVR